jgi:hypothetical protein
MTSRFALVLASVVAASNSLSTFGLSTWTGAGGTNWAAASWSPAAPGTLDTALFGDTGSSTLPNDMTVFLDQNRTIGGLAFSNTAGKYTTLDLDGKTLTVNGNLMFNVDRNAATTTTIRNGTLTVNSASATIYAGSAVSSASVGTPTLAGLTAFNATVADILVGASTGTGSSTGQLTLSPLNNITAQRILVGAQGTSGSADGVLHFGLSNTVIVNEFTIGRDSSGVGNVDIASGGSLTLGSVSQRTLLQIGMYTLNASNTFSSAFNMGNATINFNLDSLIVGQRSGTSGTTTAQLYGGGSGTINIGTAAARGTWVAGYNTNNGALQATMDLSHMTTITAYVTDFIVGKGVSGSATTTAALAANTTIDASNGITIGYTQQGNNVTLGLGQTTTIITPQISIGQDLTSATVQASAGSVMNIGNAGNRTALKVMTGGIGNQGQYNSKLDLSGSTLNAYLSDLIVSQAAGQNAGMKGTVTASSGFVNVGAGGNTANIYVGYVITGGTGATGTVNFSGLSTMTANLNRLWVGVTTGSASATGTMWLPATSSINASSIYVGIGDGDGTLNLGKTTTITTPEIKVSQNYGVGTITAPAGSTVAIGSAGARTNLSVGTGSISFNPYNGTVDLTSAQVTAYFDTVILGAKTGYPASGSLLLGNSAGNYVDMNTVTMGSSDGTGVLTFSAGTMVIGSVSAGGAASKVNFNWNGGTLAVGAYGTAPTPLTLTNNGTGTLSPGKTGTVGTTTINGAYTQGINASLAIDIAGVAPGTGNDVVAISGAATLAGSLKVTLQNGFVPSLGQAFLIASYASKTGTFGFVAPPAGLPQGAAMQVDYSSATQLYLRIVAPTSQTWNAGAGTFNFSTAANWLAATAPGTASALTINNTSASPLTVNVDASTTVHRIDLSATTSTATLYVPSGFKLGVGNQITVGTGGVLGGGGQILGNIVVTGGTVLSSSGTLVVNGFINNQSGTINATAGNQIVTNGPDVNGGSIALAGGTFDTSGYSLTNNGQVSGNGTLKAGAFINGGTYNFVGTLQAGALTNSGDFTHNGPLTATAITNSGTMTFTGVTNLVAVTPQPGSPAAMAGQIAGDAAGNLMVGHLKIGANGELTAARVRQEKLAIGDLSTTTGAKLMIPQSFPDSNAGTPAGDNSYVSRVKEISIAKSGGNFLGTLDLTNNDLIIDYAGGSSPLAEIEAMVKSAYNNGTWTGKGITSSVAAADPGLFHLAVADNALLGGVAIDNFDGIDTSNHQQVLVKFTWVADINLDGLVDANDAIAFATYYSEGLTGAHHQFGDLNYDGVVNSNDAILFATAYNASLPHLPEPAGLGILALGSMALLCRRRRA